MLESIAREFTGKPNLQVQFTNYPLPPSGLVVMRNTAGIFLGSMMFVILVMQGVAIRLMIQRIEGGFYDTVMMSGATKFTYWTAHYLKDVAIYMTFGVVNFVIMYFFA